MRILFVCVENAGRSQMAEAFAKRLAPPGVGIFSAGSSPAESVHPEVIKAMREVGMDLASCKPKGFEALPPGPFDVVVGMGCGDSCPPRESEDQSARRMVVWEIPNPKGQPPEGVRRIRNEIETKVRTLLEDLKGSDP